MEVRLETPEEAGGSAAGQRSTGGGYPPPVNEGPDIREQTQAEQGDGNWVSTSIYWLHMSFYIEGGKKSKSIQTGIISYITREDVSLYLNHL